ncbi:MAG: pyruvate, phosphate dikinase [Candidatus Berkelbacteria bacterium]|nr:pyruvate, phosphate dikinase [Candidatus Berkelbacteria bacterium]
MSEKLVYRFGNGTADGNGEMKSVLGGKGANLAEMAGHPKLKLPVPAGITIPTTVCTHYYENKRKYPADLEKEVENGVKFIEEVMTRGFGNLENPLLVSVRSGAAKSMPGMMETILNVGLTSKTIPGLVVKTGNEWFVYDSYRRLLMMYSDVVMEKAAGIEPAEETEAVRRQLEHFLGEFKKDKGYKSDTDMKVEDLKLICKEFKKIIKKTLKKDFPDDPWAQLWGAVGAVFASWMGKRACEYRRIENIPDAMGTAVNIQAMIFGNLNDLSATGVAFTRSPETGDDAFYGEFLVKAQGEDVVAGIRTPAPINESSRNSHNKHLETLEEWMPKVYKELHAIRDRLEIHFADMLDVEFTIEDRKLWMLQCRVGKRNGIAAVQMALDMLKEKLIDEKTAVMRVRPEQLDELLHPVIDPVAEKLHNPVAKGLPASPGGAHGEIVFTAEDAVAAAKKGKHVILVRDETSPEDVAGMRAAQAILTARGGRTSHAALVARGWGKCCVVGCDTLQIDYRKKTLTVGEIVLNEGDVITVNGTNGHFYVGALPMIKATNTMKNLEAFIKICDKHRDLKVRANADSAKDLKQALEFGAEGVGLFRAEHMFYGEGSDKPLFLLRKMIISVSLKERQKALDELFVHVKADIKSALEAAAGLPVTIRLLDPPLHEFVPKNPTEQKKLADSLKISAEEFTERANKLHESNPMMGHRGVRLGITHPEITAMQCRAIFVAAAEIIKAGGKAKPEIMIPVVCTELELINQKVIVEAEHKKVVAEFGFKIPHHFGTMIEIPRACIVADKLAVVSEFFSFGTNDLTQMTFGFSRDDAGSFVPSYLDADIIPADPFQTLDQSGVGELLKMGLDRGRSVKKDLKIGICGEHGGDPESVKFCHKAGLSYVSCSPFRIPIAKLAAAQAAIENPRTK